MKLVILLLIAFLSPSCWCTYGLSNVNVVHGQLQTRKLNTKYPTRNERLVQVSRPLVQTSSHHADTEEQELYQTHFLDYEHAPMKESTLSNNQQSFERHLCEFPYTDMIMFADSSTGPEIDDAGSKKYLCDGQVWWKWLRGHLHSEGCKTPRIFNYARAHATVSPTRKPGPPSTRDQIEKFINDYRSGKIKYHKRSKRVYILWAGGNDVVKNPLRFDSAALNSEIKSQAETILKFDPSASIIIGLMFPADVLPFSHRGTPKLLAKVVQKLDKTRDEWQSMILELQKEYPRNTIIPWDAMEFTREVVSNAESYGLHDNTKEMIALQNSDHSTIHELDETFVRNDKPNIWHDMIHMTTAVHELFARRILELIYQYSR
ncbi:hypothetical protein MP638_006741 [Amoeboaphelidium occidentale]|nr:hypothetical protein MP638_006741 [Amoeboaphelidium occidentale]